MNISNKEGELLVKIARNSIELYIEEGKKLVLTQDLPKKFFEKSGVFVTINKCENKIKELRGCIGHPYPTDSLIDAIIDSGIAAATEDPRFVPLSKNELTKICIEISILTNPELLIVKSPIDYLSQIKIGQDGLIVKSIWGSGLLLPQVPIEYNWDLEDFLSHTCIKAGAPPDAWLLPETKIYKFQAIIFEEEQPKGKIVKK